MPGTPAYEAATQTFNQAAPAAPAAAVLAHTVDDVRAAVKHASASGLRVRSYTTGHAAATFGPMDDALLVRTALEGEVEVDVAARTARIPAGTLWGAVVASTSPHGLASVHGTSPTVGVVGYLLRGGVSFYGRELGLASGSVRAIELVTADGEWRRVDADSDAELFWALRGGGGGFGVVTAVEIALHPVPAVLTGAAFWPAALASELVPRWVEWTADAPRAASTSLRIMNLPPMPGRPEAISSGPVVCLDGAILSATNDLSAARAVFADLFAPLRAIGEPVHDTWHEAGPEAVPATHMDPPNPVKAIGDHMLLGEVNADTVAEFVRVTGEGSGSPLLAAELRQLGGALADPDPAGGVLNHIDGTFVYQCVGAAINPDLAGASLAHAAVVRSVLAPWDTGRTVPAFVGSHTQPQGHLSPDQITEVDRIRQAVDPDALFAGDISPNATQP
jgi:FAD/FMN-containing dehydrogenase